MFRGDVCLVVTYQVSVTPTVEAYNHDDCMPTKCSKYIRETFEDTPYSVDVEFPTPRPDPPSEDPFYGPDEHPCNGESKDYSNLLGWWQDYIKDCTDWDITDDSYLLITDNTGLGGVAYGGGTFAVSAAYQLTYFDCLSSADSKGCATEDDAAQTCVHETGHNLGLEQEDGWAEEGSDTYTTTPLLNGYVEQNDGSDNACEKYIEEIDTSKVKCHLHTWSDCSQSKL